MAPTKTEKKGKAQEVKAKAVPKKAEVAKAAPKKVEDKKGAKKAPAKKESSSEEESSEEEEEEEESSEEEKESEEKEESSEEESSEEEEEEKEKEEEEEESSSEEEEEEKDSSEEESSEEEESEEEESEDDDEEEEEEAKPAAKKRKNDEESEQPSKRQAVEGTKLFVASLPYSIDSDGLAELFGKFGNVTDAFVSVDNGRSKGFGFVTFDSEASAKKALKMNGHEIDGRALKVEISRPKEAGGKPERKPFQSQGSSEASKVLFVGNLSFNTGKDELIEAFGSCDGLQDARVATERETGRPRGFGYVEFDSAENAKAAMDSMGGADVGGRNIRLDFAGERSSNGGGDRGGYGGDRGGFRGGRGGFRGGDRGGFRGGRGGGDRGGFRGGRGGGDRGGFRGGRGGFRGGRGGSFGGGEGRKTTFDD